MAKIVFQISYEIIPEKREEYLDTIKQLQEHLNGNAGKKYLVLEDKNRSNHFTEIYICENEEEYENLENETDELTFNLTNKVFANFIIDRKANYTTLYQVE